jgi:antitoxin (DNA-binding transcriptional repressor) of toxin-antitoxin stability system
LTLVLSLRKLEAIFNYFLDRIDKTIFIENHPMITISLKEAQAKLPDLIHNLKPGEELLITDNDRLLAKLVGQSSTPSQRPGPGLCKGMITIVADDEEHLQEFAEYLP